MDAREALERYESGQVYAVLSPDQNGMATRQQVAPRAFDALRAVLERQEKHAEALHGRRCLCVLCLVVDDIRDRLTPYEGSADD